MLTFRAFIAVCATALCSLGLSGCASNPGATPQVLAKEARTKFSQPGPYAVGVTTLKLADRSVEVYYPASHAVADRQPPATYLQTDPIPPAMLAMLPKLPAGADLSITIPARRDVAAATGGPFPLVIFSHGAGGWRGGHGELLSGIASWGFVVASTDYIEYGFVSQFTGASRNAAGRRPAVAAAVDATIGLMAEQTRDPGGRLRNTIDLSRIGAVGHSAGGGTMFGKLDDPRIGTIIGWAPVPPEGPVSSHTPTMIIAGEKDIAISPTAASSAYATLQTPKRFVLVGNLGHNAVSDSCLAIRNGNDLVGLAKQLGLGIPQGLLALARNGCGADDLDTRAGWAIVQHFTVAQLRSGLGIDQRPHGLGETSGRLFSGAAITYREELK